MSLRMAQREIVWPDGDFSIMIVQALQRNKQPRRYLGDAMSNTAYFPSKMKHHLIPCDDQSGIWLKNVKRGFSKFINQRADLICQTAEDEAEIQLFRRD
jgi:hypothetical protein